MFEKLVTTATLFSTYIFRQFSKTSLSNVKSVKIYIEKNVRKKFLFFSNKVTKNCMKMC